MMDSITNLHGIQLPQHYLVGHHAINMAGAAEQLARLEGKLHADARAWAWSIVGWQAAQRHQPEALDAYRQAGEAPLSDEVSQWKVRAALRAQDWGMVRNAIERMFCRLKDFRRIATRYDKLARNFLSAVSLAAAVAFWL